MEQAIHKGKRHSRYKATGLVKRKFSSTTAQTPPPDETYAKVYDVDYVAKADAHALAYAKDGLDIQIG